MGISWVDNILKVDSFLTHQVDFSLMREIGKVFAEKICFCWHYQGRNHWSVGYCPSYFYGEALNVPMIFAKKAKNITMNEGILTAEVYSLPSR